MPPNPVGIPPVPPGAGRGWTAEGRLAMCIIGFILGATRFDHHLLLFLDWRGAVLPPALVVMLVAAMLPQRLSAAAALTAWLVGAAVAIVFKAQGQLAHIVVGAVVSLIILKVMLLLSSNTQKTATLLFSAIEEEHLHHQNPKQR